MADVTTIHDRASFRRGRWSCDRLLRYDYRQRFVNGKRTERRKTCSLHPSEDHMAELEADDIQITRDRLAELLNEDLAREYQAIIAYVVYSQVLSGAEYMDIAAQLEVHAEHEIEH